MHVHEDQAHIGAGPRIDEHGAHHGAMPTRFVHDEAAEGIGEPRQPARAIGKGRALGNGRAADDEAQGGPADVGVDGRHLPGTRRPLSHR